MSATGRADVRQKDDFYETPAWAIRAILPHLALSGSILEPCAGRGAIVTELLTAGVSPDLIMANELDSGRAKICRAATGVDTCNLDFLRPDFTGTQADLILTNPPYTLAEKFIRQALRNTSLKGEVAMLLRVNFLASKKRIAFWREHPAHIYVLPLRPSFGIVLRDIYQCPNCRRRWKVPHGEPFLIAGSDERCSCTELPVFRKTTKTTHDACEYAWFCFGPTRQRRWDVLELGGDHASVPRAHHRRLPRHVQEAEGLGHAG